MFTGDNYFEYRRYLKDLEYNNKNIMRVMQLLDNENGLENLFNDNEISNEDFINIVALKRLADYDPNGSGAGEHDDAQTDQGYDNTPLKFIEEFLQNADDCEYQSTPEIEVMLKEADENHSIIEFTYNEDGFTKEDIWFLTARGKSTKGKIEKTDLPDEGIFYRKKTGKKGTGFKSVFTLAGDNVVVHISSNGYNFRLDRNMGRTIPVYEEKKFAINGFTHIVVEIYYSAESKKNNTSIKSIDETYSEIKNIFCIDDTSDFFKKDPLVFARKIKTFNVFKDTKSGDDTFKVKFVPSSVPVFGATFFSEDKMESGIRHQSRFCKNLIEKVDIQISDSGKEYPEVIPILKYTAMIKIDDTYSNAAIISPIMTETIPKWKSGSLFTTFPLRELSHNISLPYSIDASFELNLQRKAIDYKKNKYNQSILDALFMQGGILEQFVKVVREQRDIRMDHYVSSSAIKLFDEDVDANRDSNYRKYIEVIDLSKLLKNLSLFRVYGTDEEFVSYNEAFTLNDEMLNWLMIGNVVKVEGKKLACVFIAIS